MRYEARSLNRRTSQAKPQPDGDMLDVVLAIWKLSAKECGQKHLQETEAAESAESNTKVTEWLQSMEETA